MTGLALAAVGTLGGATIAALGYLGIRLLTNWRGSPESRQVAVAEQQQSTATFKTVAELLTADYQRVKDERDRAWKFVDYLKRMVRDHGGTPPDDLPDDPA